MKAELRVPRRIEWICTRWFNGCWVHIRHLCLTEIMVSLLQRVTFSKRRKSNQKGLPLAYGLRCAQVPSFRSRSVGTPPRAILGPSRLSRHPCRSTHCAEPPLGLPMGRVDQNICSLWEPGLPAMQAPRSTWMTNVLPSRASPLPQEFSLFNYFAFATRLSKQRECP
jgi:hypothetical protein